MRYAPSMPPTDPAQVGSWAQRELFVLWRALMDGIDTLRLVPQAVAPAKPSEGTVANADGTNWNPGGGAGLYQYLGGAWVKL